MADRHVDHDLLLVAALAAGDLEAGEQVRAEALVADCAECQTLAADLRAIAHATAEVPAPRRTRNFFLSPMDAERLRPSGLRRLAAAIARPRIQVARPLAGGLMMLGFAGLLVASLPGVSQRASLPASDQRLEAAQATPTPESDLAGGEPQAAGPSAQPNASGSQLVDGPGDAFQGSEQPIEPGSTSGRETAPGPSALVVGSVALLGLGAALFLASVVRSGARPS